MYKLQVIWISWAEAKMYHFFNLKKNNSSKIQHTCIYKMEKFEKTIKTYEVFSSVNNIVHLCGR
jgi:hypothetical protein